MKELVMSLKALPPCRFLVGSLGLAAILAASVSTARANVYATNLRLNADTNNVTVPPGIGATISFILNEPASAGVTITLQSGAATVRTIKLAAGEPGTLRGPNSVVWDGKNDSGGNLAGGTYTVSITAASAGYTSWTQITDDANEGNLVPYGGGIAVDRNATSPFYGRVLVANAKGSGFGPGADAGILKLNADGSAADEGIFSDGGYVWGNDYFSPWHLEVSDDDFVYVNDWTSNGQVIRWDPTISTNTQLLVLRDDNWGNSGLVNLSGPALFGSSATTSLWMADASSFDSLGVLKYVLTQNGDCATNDYGTTVVGIGSETNLSVNPYDVALDKLGNIYTIQKRADPGDPAPRVLRFLAYDPSTNGSAPELTADWAVGAGDDTMAGAMGVAVDPTGTYVAVAFRGVSSPDGLTNGCTQILYATNGAVVTNLDLGVALSGEVNHEDADCAWDAVGNVYFIDNYLGVWRAFSPPGANQATTAARPTIQVSAPQPIQITGLTVANGTVTISFTASGSDAPSAFTLLSATSPSAVFAPAAGASILATAPGQFTATVTAEGPTHFYRIQK